MNESAATALRRVAARKQPRPAVTPGHEPDDPAPAAARPVPPRIVDLAEWRGRPLRIAA